MRQVTYLFEDIRVLDTQCFVASSYLVAKMKDHVSDILFNFFTNFGSSSAISKLDFLFLGGFIWLLR